MRNKNLFFISCLHLVFLLTLSSCAKSEDINISRPQLGKSVSEITIKGQNDEELHIADGMSHENSIEVFSKLKGMDNLYPNYDISLDLKDEQHPNAKASHAIAKYRGSNHQENGGFYRYIESGDVVMEAASHHLSQFQYSSFSFTKYKGQFVAFWGHVPTKETIDGLNKSGERPVIYYSDPDVKPGSYTRKDTTISEYPTFLEESSVGYNIFYTKAIDSDGDEEIVLTKAGDQAWICRRAMTSSPYSLKEIMKPVTVLPLDGSSIDLECKLSYKLSENYLLIDINKPYGISRSSFYKEENIYAFEESQKRNSYLSIKYYYDVATGDLEYFESVFDNYQFEFGSFCKGKLVFRKQPQSDEGYLKYQQLKKEVVENATDFDPKY